MKWLLGVLLIASALGSCGGEEMVADELLLSIPVSGGDLNAIRGADTCEGPEPTAGPVVLFLHGASFNATTWVDTGTHQLLCEANIPSISIDLPGFGRSDRFEHDRVALLTEVVEYIAADVILVSPSMSGSYALPWLMTNPTAAAGYVAVAPVGIAGWATPDEFEVPTLGLWGSEDSVVPIQEGKRLVSLIPGARLVEIEGGGHAVYKTNPTEFHAEFLEFVESLR